MIRVERHRLGLRLHLFGRRFHEVHLGLALLAALGIGVATDLTPLSSRIVSAMFVGLWLVAKDWRDLFPSRRDTASWQIGLHRRAFPLRRIRHLDSLPTLAALAAAGIGLANVVSAVTPTARWRGHLLLKLGPVGEVPLFHALALPAAAALFVSAFYLYKRRRAAAHLAVALLVVLAFLSLLKGLDFEEAVGNLAAAGLLWRGRNSFQVRHDPISLRSALWQVPALLAGSVSISWLAVSVAAPAGAKASTVTRETIELLLWQDGPLQFHDDVGRLPLGIQLLSISTVLAACYLIFRPLAAPRILPAAEARAAATELVRAHGSDTLSFFKLRRDKHYLFSPDRRAFLGYRVENGVLLLSGDPVGPREALPDLLRTACAFAAERGLRLGGVGVSETLLPLGRQAGLRSFYLGDEAIVDTASFSLEGRPIRKVRQSVTRLQKAGYTAKLRELDSIAHSELAELDEIAAAWREGAPERGFSMAMESLLDSPHKDTMVLIARDHESVARGFLHFVPTYGRSAMSLSFMRRDRDTPNGLTEFMVARALELLRERRIEEVSLNFAAFARLLHSPRGAHERVLGRLVALANPFFQIESLYSFNAKFFPRWEPRYLLYEGPLGLPRTGLAAMWAEGHLGKPRRPAWKFFGRSAA